jgi:predicted permease
VGIDLRVDPRVGAVAFVLSGFAAAAFALLPALQTTREDLVAALHGMGASADRRRTWLRGLLVSTQVAVALLLLVLSALFLRSLQEAARVDIGFQPAGVDTLQIETRIGGYRTASEGIRVVEALTERFRALPGVSHVGASRMVPLQGGGLGLGGLRAPGYTAPDGSDAVDADWDVVSADYFAALQIPLLRGRPFTALDREGSPLVAIVNQTMAERLWPGQDPIGRTLLQERSEEGEQELQVIGVARDAKYRTVSENRRNFIYVPLAQQFLSELTFYVRRGDGPSRSNDLRRAVAAFDPMLPVIHTDTLERASALGLLPQRLAAWIAACVGAIGLFLAALGLHGITSFAVSQRRREIAIRVAIGAAPRSVLILVFRQAAVLALVGAAAGLLMAAAAGRSLEGFLIGLGPVDPAAYAGATVLLLLVTLASSWTPARRAAATHPVEALRGD